MLTVQTCTLDSSFCPRDSLTFVTDIYYIAFPDDTWQRKSVVCTAYFLETTQVILATHDAFRVYGSGWGVVPELDKIGLLWLNTPLFAGLSK